MKVAEIFIDQTADFAELSAGLFKRSHSNSGQSVLVLVGVGYAAEVKSVR